MNTIAACIARPTRLICHFFFFAFRLFVSSPMKWRAVASMLMNAVHCTVEYESNVYVVRARSTSTHPLIHSCQIIITFNSRYSHSLAFARSLTHSRCRAFEMSTRSHSQLNLNNSFGKWRTRTPVCTRQPRCNRLNLANKLISIIITVVIIDGHECVCVCVPPLRQIEHSIQSLKIHGANNHKNQVAQFRQVAFGFSANKSSLTTIHGTVQPPSPPLSCLNATRATGPLSFIVCCGTCNEPASTQSHTCRSFELYFWESPLPSDFCRLPARAHMWPIAHNQMVGIPYFVKCTEGPTTRRGLDKCVRNKISN